MIGVVCGSWSNEDLLIEIVIFENVQFVSALLVPMAVCANFHTRLFAGLCPVLLILGWVLLVVLSPTGEATTKKQEGVCANLRGLNHTAASCKDFGGCHGYCPGNTCQCTSQCSNIGNCCRDFLEVCMNESHIHFELEKLEEEKQKLERGAGIVGREWILSLVMVFFVLTMMAVLYFAHSKNADMQNAVYELMCTTVSIFATNTFTVALHGVLIEQIWMGKYPGLNQAAGPVVQAKIYGLLSMCVFAGSNWLIYSFRHTQQRYSAFGQLSSHMTAFTLIQATGELQWSVRDDGFKCLLVPQTSWNHFVVCRECGSLFVVAVAERYCRGPWCF